MVQGVGVIMVQNFEVLCFAPPHPTRSAELTVEALSHQGRGSFGMRTN